MLDYRAKFFDAVQREIISKGKKVYLYFYYDYKYEQAELVIKYRPYIKVDDSIKKIFNSLDKDKIASAMSPKYRDSWLESYQNTKKDLTNSDLLSLNQAAQTIFSPYMRPRRSAHNTNIYVAFYFSLEEVNQIIDPNTIHRFEKTVLNNKTLYTIDVTAKSLKSNYTADNVEKVSNSVSKKTEPYFDKSEDLLNAINKDAISETVRINKISLSNFINFNPIEQSFSPSINLIIGKNNTGKTNLLKLLYSVVKSLEDFIKQKKLYDRTYKSILSKKIQEIFQSSKESIGTIVSKNTTDNLIAEINFKYLEENESITFSFGKTTKKEIIDVEITKLLNEESAIDFNTIFIPAKEILSINEAIKNSFRNFIKGFDATYNDLTELITPFIEKNGIPNEFIKIIDSIENDILNGKIEYDEIDKEFIFKNKEGQKFEMTMTAEGIKQVGIIPILINTGQLHAGSILFLDEPDNNLNPATINKFVKILTDLAKAGVQIFISSHNYFILKRLHISAKENKNIDFRVFSLIDYKNESKIDIEVKDLKLGLPKYNPIVEEALKMFDDDIKADLQ